MAMDKGESFADVKLECCLEGVEVMRERVGHVDDFFSLFRYSTSGYKVWHGLPLVCESSKGCDCFCRPDISTTETLDYPCRTARRCIKIAEAFLNLNTSRSTPSPSPRCWLGKNNTYRDGSQVCTCDMSRIAAYARPKRVRS